MALLDWLKGLFGGQKQEETPAEPAVDESTNQSAEPASPAQEESSTDMPEEEPRQEM